MSIICRGCEKVGAEVENENLVGEVMRITGFKAVISEMDIFYVCPECKEKVVELAKEIDNILKDDSVTIYEILTE